MVVSLRFEEVPMVPLSALNPSVPLKLIVAFTKNKLLDSSVKLGGVREMFRGFQN